MRGLSQSKTKAALRVLGWCGLGTAAHHSTTGISGNEPNSAFGIKRQNAPGACWDDTENLELQMLGKPGNAPWLGEARELANEALNQVAELVSAFARWCSPPSAMASRAIIRSVS